MQISHSVEGKSKKKIEARGFLAFFPCKITYKEIAESCKYKMQISNKAVYIKANKKDY